MGKKNTARFADLAPGPVLVAAGKDGLVASAEVRLQATALGIAGHDGELESSSEAFRAAWESYDIEALPSRERLFRHPDVGDLHMEQHSLTPSDNPRVQLVIFTPMPATDTAERLRRLLDMRAIRLAGAQSQPRTDISVTG